MQRFAVKKIYALNGKGKVIPGTIHPIHEEYRLDSPEGESKMHLFGVARQGKSLEQTKALHLEVLLEQGRPAMHNIGVKVLYAHTFGLENLTDGDYWDEVPTPLRFHMQNRLADELMELADPDPPGLLSAIPRRRYPYQGVAFAVSGLDQLAALFPPEAAA